MSYQESLGATDDQIDACWDIHDTVIGETHQLAAAEYAAYMRGMPSILTRAGLDRLNQPFYDAAADLVSGCVTSNKDPLPAPSDPIFPWLPL